MNFIRNRNFRAGPQTSLEGFICPQNSDKKQKIKVFGRSGGVKICIKHLADNSFGIYIFHMLWVNILYKVVKFNPLEYGVWVIVPMMLLILVASDITTLVYKRIPYIGKFI